MKRAKVMLKRGLVVASLLVAAVLRAQQATEVLMGMQIERVDGEKAPITIVTTGAKFLLKPNGTVTCWQRIPRERKVLDIIFPKAASPFYIEKKDDFSSTVSFPGATLRIQGDSVAILKLEKDLTARFRGQFRPAYHYEKDGNWMVVDPEGGFGIYPVAKKKSTAPDFSKPSWNITYSFTGGDEVWLSVFPPRPYNWQRAFEPIAHESLDDHPYPSDEVIRSDARHCKIFTLHADIWQDAADEFKDIKTGPYAGVAHQPWYTAKHIPLDMKEFVRAREEVHKQGMKLVVYVSPLYSHAPNIFAEMTRVLDEYQVDGLYFDGAAAHFRASYAVMRRARQILGENRILYYHCTTEPLDTDRIYCPFIDTYADYILRGEAGVFGLKLDDFLRWSISGYNISNAVGYWCYYGSNRQQGYDANSPERGKYFDTIPTTEHIEAAFRNHAFIWRTAQYWTSTPGREADLERFDREYYAKLKSLRQCSTPSPHSAIGAEH